MFTIRQAAGADIDIILMLRAEAARWIAGTGTDQWQQPWPTPEEQLARFASSLAAGEVWLLRERGTVAGTVTMDEFADPRLWTPAERAEPAYYVHNLIIARDYGGQGLGAMVLDWCCYKAARGAKLWIRIDVWTSNTKLQRYYLEEGFRPVRTLCSGYPAGALLQRPAERAPVGRPVLRETS